jgi:flagellar basal body rod protein FlgB
MANADGCALPATRGAAPNRGTAPGAGRDVEAEMMTLADEQLRYETTAKLLEKTYQKIRLSIRDR